MGRIGSAPLRRALSGWQIPSPLPCREGSASPQLSQDAFLGGFIFPSEGGSSPSSPAPGQQQGAELTVLSSDSLLSQGLLPLQS